VLMALAPNLVWLFAARVASGVASSTMATANAYIADVTPPDDRAARFGLLGAAWGAGFVLGPAIGGLLGELGPRAPFWGSAILAGLNLVYGFFVLPESLPKTSRAAFSVRLANQLSAVTFFAAKPGFALLGVAIFLTGLASQVLGGTWIPYVTYRYHWSSAMSGASLAAVGASYIVVQSLIVGRFVARFGETAAIYAGLLTVVAAYVIFAASPWTWLFMAAIPLFALGGLGAPGMQAILSREVPATEQGRLQGARAGLGAIAGLLGPVLFTETFARSISTWRSWATPGAAFLLAAALLLTAFILTAATLGGAGWKARLAASKTPGKGGEAP
jgi:DHA1 family tetracycline resistance protein-like MFS transporter